MSDPLYSLELRHERDVFTARQAGREVAAAVGLEGQDLVRVATALSEVSRDVVAAGGGDVSFSVTSPDLLCVELVTSGPAHELRRQAADGGGVEAARRLVDTLTLATDTGGHAVITFNKKVARVADLGSTARADLRQRVSLIVLHDPIDELRTQNRELVGALEEVQARRDEGRSGVGPEVASRRANTRRRSPASHRPQLVAAASRPGAVRRWRRRSRL